MAAPTTQRVLDAAGRTYAQQAGFAVHDRPAPLFQLAVLAALLAKPLDADLSAAAAGELRRAGVRTPHTALQTTWQQRVDALGRAHYRRFDESMATRVEEIARFVLDSCHGDLRRLVAAANEQIPDARALLQEVPGIGPAGADIFLREAQTAWPWAAPYLDDRVLAGAKRLGWPDDRAALARRYRGVDAAQLSAALVRVSLSDELAATLNPTGNLNQ